ncbi:Uncharacterized protein BM_BM13258, partial [Brugia malayi]
SARSGSLWEEIFFINSNIACLELNYRLRFSRYEISIL